MSPVDYRGATRGFLEDLFTSPRWRDKYKALQTATGEEKEKLVREFIGHLQKMLHDDNWASQIDTEMLRHLKEAYGKNKEKETRLKQITEKINEYESVHPDWVLERGALKALLDEIKKIRDEHEYEEKEGVHKKIKQAADYERSKVTTMLRTLKNARHIFAALYQHAGTAMRRRILAAYSPAERQEIRKLLSLEEIKAEEEEMDIQKNADVLNQLTREEGALMGTFEAAIEKAENILSNKGKGPRKVPQQETYNQYREHIKKEGAEIRTIANKVQRKQRLLMDLKQLAMDILSNRSILQQHGVAIYYPMTEEKIFEEHKPTFMDQFRKYVSEYIYLTGADSYFFDEKETEDVRDQRFSNIFLMFLARSQQKLKEPLDSFFLSEFEDHIEEYEEVILKNPAFGKDVRIIRLFIQFAYKERFKAPLDDLSKWPREFLWIYNEFLILNRDFLAYNYDPSMVKDFGPVDIAYNAVLMSFFYLTETERKRIKNITMQRAQLDKPQKLEIFPIVPYSNLVTNGLLQEVPPN
ncbi:hypothetical protein J4453_02990 [Candidatus Woesearchaeota archaeon]|nr:hypothetical protein [Candidatus Woesearchaeota archaeon]